ncbi:hypothetical protein VC83_07517 [Pseudogymnoascus destructans]|uniref:Uncharacterized protein n=1 Tax=Pseudogymnoascus destructans TaxID=655981 RepID=A0A177A4R0_9PEZI|nr:uncharacterized protein VC83_07517 [Pseudogymnoascus destructans]OAF56083.1 hypothetical protein VC83_07517 [Pseudogymnoascus destructans]
MCRPYAECEIMSLCVWGQLFVHHFHFAFVSPSNRTRAMSNKSKDPFPYSNCLPNLRMGIVTDSSIQIPDTVAATLILSVNPIPEQEIYLGHLAPEALAVDFTTEA